METFLTSSCSAQGEFYCTAYNYVLTVEGVEFILGAIFKSIFLNVICVLIISALYYAISYWIRWVNTW